MKSPNKTKKLLLNCDLGEWESLGTMAALIPHLHLANIACGGHAGSMNQIKYATQIAKRHGVHCGPHPGVPTNKGRSLPKYFDPNDFSELLTTQISDYLAATLMAPLHHLKLHGALYHLSETDPTIRDVLFHFLQSLKIPLICLANGNVAREAAARKIPHLQEAFLDRHYQADGQLLPRDHPDALIHDEKTILARLEAWQNEKPIPAYDGTPIFIKPDTLCIHSDSPNALGLLKLVRKYIDK